MSQVMDAMFHVDEIVDAFNKDYNVRDKEFGYEENHDTLYSDLVAKGHVTDPVHLAVADPDMTVAQFKKLSKEKQRQALVGLKGFRRTNLSWMIVHGEGEPLPGRDKFSAEIPARIVFGMTPQEQMEYRLDHGTNKSLNEWELLKCIKGFYENDETGDTREKKIIYTLRKIFDAHQSEGERKKLEKKLSEFENDPETKKKKQNPAWYQDALMDVYLKHFRGRFQKLKRIMHADSWVQENFRKEVYGDPEAIHLTNEHYAHIDKQGLKGDDLSEYIEEVQQKRRASDDSKISRWTNKAIEDKIAVAECEWVEVILKATTGDKEAGKKYPKVVKELRKISNALDNDPELKAKLTQ